jgi:hypothetical protein
MQDKQEAGGHIVIKGLSAIYSSQPCQDYIASYGDVETI